MGVALVDAPRPPDRDRLAGHRRAGAYALDASQEEGGRCPPGGLNRSSAGPIRTHRREALCVGSISALHDSHAAPASLARGESTQVT